jgi:hypothetical protein
MDAKRIQRLHLYALFALLLLQPFVHADEDYGGSEIHDIFDRTWCGNPSSPLALPSCGAGNYGWGVMALLAVLAVFFALTIIYMFGHGFGLENVKRFAKAEFYEFGASTFIILFVAYLLWAGGNIFGFINEKVIGTGSTVICNGRVQNVVNVGGPIAIAKCNIQDKIIQLDKLYDRVYKNNMKIETWASACFILFGVQIFCGDWVVHSVVEQAHLIGEKIVPLQVSLHAQYVLLEYISKNMLGVFLPLGILLRVFPLTRGMGGLLIATALGFYFVFPIIFVLTDPTFVKADSTFTPPLTQGEACFDSFKGATAVYNSFLMPSLDSVEMSYGSVTDLLSRLTVSMMFYPFVAFAVTIIFIRSLTPVLGGDTGDLARMVAKLV